MKYSKWEKQFTATIAMAVLALIWFYMVCKFFFANNMLLQKYYTNCVCNAQSCIFRYS